ncbi:hypothetical protein [Alicyclobacillus fastidiosus]|uniref:hypothetical protein n=1 Tax=Alicyclobacillus fastidiosus TaxID=392011 RepID=UPI0023E9D254|nr:hypothetical protein [Alicyclobacillus fastidiosus]GMA61499.1 hypothetical protein GCM10025859_19390 [Alicyclobacillus fastidiosus]
MARKQQQKNILKYEVTGLVMLTGCALALGKLGLVGQTLAVISIFLAGSWYFLIPILTGYAAIYMMFRRSRFIWDSRHVGILIILLCLLGFMEMQFYSHQLLQFQSKTSLATAQWNALQELKAYIFHPATNAAPLRLAAD